MSENPTLEAPELSSDSLPPSCSECGRLAGRHNAGCSRFEIRDMADVAEVLLAAEEEQRRRRSLEGIRDDLTKAFRRRCPDGVVELELVGGVGPELRARFLLTASNRWGEHYDISFSRLAFEADHFAAIEAAARQAAWTLYRQPPLCRHSRVERRPVYPAPRPILEPLEREKLFMTFELACLDCGAAVNS
jgi:hypothetical protein